MKRAAQSLGILLVLLIVVLLAAPFTAPGTRLLLALLPAASPLQVEYRSGSLGGELRLDQLVLNTGTLQLTLSDWRSQLRPACLWRSRFCLDTLEIGAVAVVVAGGETAGQPGQESRAPEPIRLPLEVRAPLVKIGRVDASWPGGSWQQQDARLNLSVNPDGVYLDEVQIASATLALEQGEPDSGDTGPPALPDLYLPLALGIDELLLEQLILQVGGGEYLIEEFALQAHWQGEELQLAALDLASPAWGSFAASGEATLAGNWPLALELTLRPDSSVVPDPLQTRPLMLQLAGAPGDLDVSLRAPGSPHLELDGHIDLLDSLLPFNVSARLLGDAPVALAGFVNEWPPVLAGLALQLPLELQAEGNLESQTLALDLALSGAGYETLAVATRITHSDNRVLIEKLELGDEETDSAVALAGTLHYGEGLAWQVEIDSPGVTLPELSDYVFGRIAGELTIEGAISTGSWQLALRDIDLAGEVNNLPAIIDGEVSLNGRDYIAAGTLELDLNGAQLQLQQGESADAAAALNLQIADLSRWEPGSRGSLELQGELQAEMSSLQLAGNLNDVRWRDVNINSGELRADLVFTEGGDLDAQLLLDEVLVGELYLDTVNVSLEGPRTEPVLELATSGRIEGLVRVAAEQAGEDWSGRVTTDGIVTPLGSLAPDQAISFSYSEGSTLLAAHCWQLRASRLCVDDWRIGPSGGGRAILDGDLNLFAALLPEQLEASGPLTAEVNAEWTPTTPLQVRAELTSRNGELTQFYADRESATFNWESLDVIVSQGPQGLDINAGIVRDDKPILDFSVILPPERDQPLEGVFRVNRFRLTALRPFLPELSLLQGELAGEVSLQGTPANPGASGQLVWSEGVVRLVSNPTELDDITLRLDFNDADIDIEGEAILGGGPVDINGSAGWRPQPGFDVAIKGSGNRLFYPPATELEASPDLRLVFADGALALSGEVVIESGVLAYEQLPPGSVTLSTDVVEVDYAGNPLTEAAALDLEARVRVRIRDRFRVKGKDLNVTVGGDLSVRKASNRPLEMFGNLNVVGGELNAYGQRLLVRQGRLTFTGLPENPELNLRAERDIPADDVKAGVHVTGTLETPDLSIYSDPVMSRTEALSYLLRGRGLDSGAGADGSALAASLGVSLVNQTGVLQELGRIPGLSNIEVGTEGSEDATTATISGYIGERIYLAYGVGLYEPVNVLTARLYLDTRLWLEVVSRLESSVDLYYSFDID
ncbi:hypothetical protein CWI75_09035 [Kineobactrum sediminis]|uniref:Translocation and assembly module TamB C-terminal domain-containing protein n=1 Tax=Kineobactrum sediminis TaxID=1905677 RepID=A0A2N5Y2T5_9GAMM|nr:translocation/assembly module TamB domain-containing protein [Kineobactrum sediminis]PLW82713.1 hypothetical protein CWI75_09035 [Kineobactrum sediminis]